MSTDNLLFIKQCTEQTTMFLNCFDRSSSAVTNAPTPVRMNNLTFNWEAPFAEVGGDIFFM
jgi:hypothetical protein